MYRFLSVKIGLTLAQQGLATEAETASERRLEADAKAKAKAKGVRKRAGISIQIMKSLMIYPSNKNL